MNTTTASPQRVFISYRREDAAAYAGRIYDAMVARFGEDNVFMDVEMEPGIDFVERINEVVSGCAALIVVIGPRWATIEDEDGNLRLHDETDFVRQEVTAACAREDVKVIPALVGKAQMPRAEQLPEDLRPLARRNALELSDGRWRYDVGRLTSTLDEAAAPPPPPRPAVPAARMLLEGVLIATVAAYVFRRLAELIPQGAEDAGEIAGVILRRGVSWALIGAVVGLWLASRTRRVEMPRGALLGLLVGLAGGVIGGAIWALPTFLPEKLPDASTREDLEVAAAAVTGAFYGGLIGALWRRPEVVAGIASGLIGGALAQVVVNTAGVTKMKMPDVAYAFAIRGAVITAVVLSTLLAIERARARSGQSKLRSRSSAAARAPAAR